MERAPCGYALREIIFVRFSTTASHGLAFHKALFIWALAFHKVVRQVVAVAIARQELALTFHLQACTCMGRGHHMALGIIPFLIPATKYGGAWARSTTLCSCSTGTRQDWAIAWQDACVRCSFCSTQQQTLRQGGGRVAQSSPRGAWDALHRALGSQHLEPARR